MWHHKTVSKTLAELESDEGKGLSNEEASRRLKRYGSNILPERKEDGAFRLLLRQLVSPLVYILLIGASLTLWLGAFEDAIFITLAVVINIGVGFWQEYRSSNILKALKRIVPMRAFVRRNWEVHELDAHTLVPGDVIILKAGSLVPADARIIEVQSLSVNEASLTGEGMPIVKETLLIHEDAPLADRRNMVFMGSVIVRGEGLAVVVHTGALTEIGRISALTQAAAHAVSPLKAGMTTLSRIIALAVLLSAILIFTIGRLQGLPLIEMFSMAIALSVAGIPEGLPAAISIALAIGAERILRKRGVVRELTATETLGAATVICVDKTGTLTEGRMHVERVITESGNEDEASIAMALANEAIVERGEREVRIHGDPTDVAKMQYFLSGGGKLDLLLEKEPRVAMLTFDNSWGFLASFHQKKKDLNVYVSGAPEKILRRSSECFFGGKARSIAGRQKEIARNAEELARQGYRVIALGVRTLRKTLTDEERRDEGGLLGLVSDLCFLGCVVISDPVRPDVKGALERARRAGIRVIMATGDHSMTALAVARELGLPATSHSLIRGDELDRLSDLELEKELKETNIFARVTPEHKMRIVQALERQGEVVAMTGDGINDAPALKQAHVGIALGSGTDVAKEASGIVILDDSFSTIVAAVEEGRISFENIRKVTVFLLSTSFTEIILILSSLVLKIFFPATPLPLAPLQILYINLLNDGFPSIAMAFEPGERDVMERPPRPKNEPILDRTSKIIIFAIGLITDLFLVAIFAYFVFKTNITPDVIRTVMFAAIGIDALLYSFAIKSLRNPLLKSPIFGNPYLNTAVIFGMIAMLAAIYLPIFNDVLHTVPLPPYYLFLIVGLGLVKFALVEFAKAMTVKDICGPEYA